MRRRYRGRKPWTAGEIASLRRWYRQLASGEIARRLGRTVKSIRQAALVHGLTRPQRRLTAADHNTILRMARDGACNPCIGRAIGIERHRVAALRSALGAPPVESRGSVASCALCRARTREATRRQCVQAGVASLAEIRALEFRRFARDAGWPEDLRPRAVQILNALHERGPMTRRQIADAIGMPWMGSRNSLHSNDREGNYLARLAAIGMVVRLGRCVYGGGSGRNTYLYSLAPGIAPRRLA